MTPRKPKVDINGYSNQQVLNYLLQKIDRKSEQQPAEEQESQAKNKVGTAAGAIPPVKSDLLIPEVTDENVKKGSKMCQSEPTRMETAPSPN